MNVFQLLLDENVDPLFRVELLKRNSDLVIWRVGDPDVPPRGTLDPEILIWCETRQFILVTNNRDSMPVHLSEHLAQGRHSPGVIEMNQNMTIGQTVEELLLIGGASEMSEYRDRLVYLPLVRSDS